MTTAAGCLLADIGGTNTRCALAGPGGELRHLAAFRNQEHPGPGAVLRDYLGQVPAAGRPDRAFIAVAAPLVGDQVRMMNIHWQFTAAGLAAELGLRTVDLHNDFAALARALPTLKPGELASVGGGTPRPGYPKVVLGPGTGLGTAGLVPVAAGGWQVVTAEGGHVTLPALDAREETVIRQARDRHGHCSAERLVSGPGLSLLQELLHGTPLPPEEITRRADGGDAAAAETLELAFRFLGTVAGNLALSFGALGGVYIGGGIVPRQLERFRRSGFRARFEAKGRYREYLAAIPVQVITAPHATLAGLLAVAGEKT